MFYNLQFTCFTEGSANSAKSTEEKTEGSEEATEGTTRTTRTTEEATEGSVEKGSGRINLSKQFLFGILNIHMAVHTCSVQSSKWLS